MSLIPEQHESDGATEGDGVYQLLTFEAAESWRGSHCEGGDETELQPASMCLIEEVWLKETRQCRNLQNHPSIICRLTSFDAHVPIYPGISGLGYFEESDLVYRH